jgi:hypothetical protein
VYRVALQGVNIVSEKNDALQIFFSPELVASVLPRVRVGLRIGRLALVAVRPCGRELLEERLDAIPRVDAV